MMAHSAEIAAQKRVLVLGAYGLIGSAMVRRLRDDGCVVTGLGRNLTSAKTVFPDLQWTIHDLANLCEEAAWQRLLAEVDFVVNCAGALQQNAFDDLERLHHHAITALTAACKSTGTALVQISAVGASPDASTLFLRSKASGDQVVRQAGIKYWIFRPGMVLAPSAYGGSAMLRMLAAVPIIQPLAKPNARLQILALADLTNAVSMAIAGEIPAGSECDLVADEAHSLRDIVAGQRRWLGFRAARSEIVLPNWLLLSTGYVADILGLLGWRSPLRSSAIKLLSEGVLGNPNQWQKLGGTHLASLDEAFARMPASAEDRIAARMALLMPLVILVLFVF